MGRRYAAVLGLLSFTAMLVRGIAGGGAWESTLGQAIAVLLAFTILGGIAGWLAERIIDDAIRSRLNTEFAARPAASATNPPTAPRRK
jgi:hypothetical protein